MKMNKSVPRRPLLYTHEGGKATRNLAPSMDLYRSVCATMLGEDTFYEGGESVLNRIAYLVSNVPLADAYAIALHAKNAMKIRHAPLWLLVNLLPHVPTNRREEYRKVLVDLIQRPDELAEVLAMVWKDGKRPIPNAIRKALAEAFHKFNAYGFAKHDHNTAEIRLRDVMFLVHPKPKSPEEAQLFHDIASESLLTPDTWEVALSTAHTPEAKKEAWVRLLSENKLGALALLRNLRNMENVGVERVLIADKLRTIDTSRVLPFRFAAAARNSINFNVLLDKAFLDSCQHLPRLAGRTLVLVDHSGSMTDQLSAKSDMTRAIAAQSLAAILQEVAPDTVVAAYSNSLYGSPSDQNTPYRGLALHKWFEKFTMNGTRTTESLHAALRKYGAFARIIIVTDAQSHSHSGLPTLPGVHTYVLNVGSYKPTISNDVWKNITGFSENIVHYIAAVEQETVPW